MRSSAILVVVLLMPLAAAAGGVNEGAEIEGTAIVSVETADVAPASERFDITVTIDEEAASNGTSVGWTTQICVNSGVCYPPEPGSLTASSDGSTWTGSLIPDHNSTYVNWRIELNWADGSNETVPEDGFGWKVWSDCWFDGEAWGGSDRSCQGQAGDDEEELPGFGAVLAVAAVAMAGLMARRD